MGRGLVLVLGLLGLGVLAAGLAAAHGNHATVSPQVSADGTVVVEEAFLTEPGYLVLRVDDGGQPGRVVGSRRLGQGRHVGVTVQADAEYWATVSGNATLWAVLHADDGDGQFDPDSDRMLTWVGGPAGERAAVARGERPVSVVTRVAGPLRDGAVPVVPATLSRPGHLVVHAPADDGLGRSLGSQSLTAGRHDDVSVPVNASEPVDGVLTVAVHAGDGDGTFEPDADPVVRAAGQPVASRYEPTNGSDPVRVNTPAEGAGTTVGDQNGSRTTEAPDAAGDSGTGAAGPGFTAAGVVLSAALLVGGRLALAGRRR